MNYFQKVEHTLFKQIRKSLPDRLHLGYTPKQMKRNGICWLSDLVELNKSITETIFENPTTYGDKTKKLVNNNTT